MAAPTETTPEAPRRVLLLSEEDVRRLLPMDVALDAVEQGLRKMALDEGQNVPRARVQTDHAMLHSMSAAIKGFPARGGRGESVVAAKAYATTRRGAEFLAARFDARSGALLARLPA